MTLANYVTELETALENLARDQCTTTLHVAKARIDALMNFFDRTPWALEQLARRVTSRLERDPGLKPWRKELVPLWTTDVIADEVMLLSNWTGENDPVPTIVTQARQAIEKGRFSLVTFLAYRIRLVAFQDRESYPIPFPPRQEGGKGPDVSEQLISSEPGPLESLVAAEEAAAAPLPDTVREDLLRSIQLTDSQLAVVLIVFDGGDGSTAALLRGKKSDDRGTRDLINRAARRLAA